MIIPDLNLLLYAVDEGSPDHVAALAWWNDTMSGAETVGLPWTVLLGFVRLMTNPRIMDAPLTADEAVDYVDRWLAHPLTTIIDPTPRHAAVMRTGAGKCRFDRGIFIKQGRPLHPEMRLDPFG